MIGWLTQVLPAQTLTVAAPGTAAEGIPPVQLKLPFDCTFWLPICLLMTPSWMKVIET